MKEFEIKHVKGYVTAIKNLLEKNSLVNELDFLKGKYLVAIDKNGTAIALAEHIGDRPVAYQVKMTFSPDMGVRKKKRLKVAFCEAFFGSFFLLKKKKDCSCFNCSSLKTYMLF